MTARQRDNLSAVIGVLLLVLLMVLILISQAGCSVAEIDVIDPEGRSVHGRAMSCLQKMDLADARWRTVQSPTTRESDIGIGSLSRDQTRAVEAIIEMNRTAQDLLKKAP
jgi:hypothetical protein